MSPRLRSKLTILLKMDLQELLTVQSDVTRLIEKQVDLLQRRVNDEGAMEQWKLLGLLPQTDEDAVNNSQHGAKATIGDDSVNDLKHPLEGNEDSEEFILTQFDTVSSNHAVDENSNRVPLRSSSLNVTPRTSPLKKNQINSSKKTKSIHHSHFRSSTRGILSPGKIGKRVPIKEENSSDNIFSREENSNDEEVAESIGDIDIDDELAIDHKFNIPNEPEISRKRKHKFSTSSKQETTPSFLTYDKKKIQRIPSIDFNINPLSEKPWILEDFLPNEDKTSVRRGRLKLEKFYEQVGKPMGLANNELNVLDGYYENKNSVDDPELAFDNMRQRSKSPPGFGRLDFPSTQERNEDKKKSQEIIKRKTKYRFLMATRNNIPAQERGFLFKKDELNRIIDNGNFTWSDADLKIYERKR